ncbi:hypothetical protein CRM22_002956 [Opisthorchis felineus]|uniref:Uncharacterized protein n=1 Tax=Opisthorchis felineus TaxID=147828 RepID=A0A4S2M9T2_OPIFE|nr:hypothetical protein CRM22_002956 [Opisthorchis felineus]
MEWQGCGIFGRFLKLIYAKKNRTNSNNSPERFRTQKTVDEINQKLEKTLCIEPEQKKLLGSNTSELETSSPESETLHSRPTTARIPFRPIHLFGSYLEKCQNGASTETVQRRSQSIVLGHLAGKSGDAKTEARCVTPDALTTVYLPTLHRRPYRHKSNSHLYNLTVSDLVNTCERIRIPRLNRGKNDLDLGVDSRISSRACRPVNNRTQVRRFAGCRLENTYPHFTTESSYNQLRREEYLKEMHRQIRLELETQVECDVSRRSNRPRRLYQIPNSVRSVAKAGIVRLLAMPLSAPTLLRLGILHKKCMKLSRRLLKKSALDRLTIRNEGGNSRIQHVTQKRILTKRRALLVPEDRSNPSQIIELYQSAASEAYNYAQDTVEVNLIQRWSWPQEGSEDMLETDQPKYTDIYKNLFVKFSRNDSKHPSWKRGSRHVRGRQGDFCPQTLLKQTDYSNVSLDKIVLEGTDWRGGLLAQGLSVNHEVGSTEERYLQQLIALARLQLLTQLEEGEAVISLRDEAKYPCVLRKTLHGDDFSQIASDELSQLRTVNDNLPWFVVSDPQHMHSKMTLIRRESWKQIANKTTMLSKQKLPRLLEVKQFCHNEYPSLRPRTLAEWRALKLNLTTLLADKYLPLKPSRCVYIKSSENCREQAYHKNNARLPEIKTGLRLRRQRNNSTFSGDDGTVQLRTDHSELSALEHHEKTLKKGLSRKAGHLDITKSRGTVWKVYGQESTRKD